MKRFVLGTAVLALVATACGGDGVLTSPATSARPTVLNAIGTDPVSGATIETNLDDYVPGEVVHVVGRGWTPSEIVRLSMTEEPDRHPDVSMEVQADAAGSFSVHFYDVQPHDWGVTFTLQATGLTSGSNATATFTDGRMVLSVVRSPNPAPPGAAVNITVTVNLDGDIGATTWSGTAWTLSNGSGVVAGPVCVNTEDHALGDGHADDAHVAAFSLTAPAQDGLYTLTIATHSSDDCSDANSDNLAVALTVTTPSNSPPTASAGGPYSGAEGSAIAVNAATASDPNGDQLTYAWTYAPGGNVDAGAGCSFSDASVLTPTVTCTDDGQYTLTLAVSDGQNSLVTATATLDVANVAPSVVVTPASNVISEGGAALYAAVITDPGANDAVGSFAWSATAAPCTVLAGSTATRAIVSCADNGMARVTLDVTDDDGGNGSAEADLTILNVAPRISAVALSPVVEGNIYPVSQPVTVTATFSDSGSADTHTCATQAVSSSSTSVVFGPSAANGHDCANTLDGLPEGVYNVTITVTDKDGASDVSDAVQVVIFEPIISGFVTGGGWIDSPAGALPANPSITGKASFGFVSKYQKGVAEGKTVFAFNAAEFSFRSTSYDLLVVNQGGSSAQFKGTGMVNGVPGYSFMVWITDGSPDRFRIKIWDPAGGYVYDNGDSRVQGSIVIHVPK